MESFLLLFFLDLVNVKDIFIVNTVITLPATDLPCLCKTLAKHLIYLNYDNNVIASSPEANIQPT